MKIRKPTVDQRSKVYALLRSAFPGSSYEARLIEHFHDNDTPLHEWVCLQAGKAIAYIAFSNAYWGKDVCGLHLAPMAVAPEAQRQGVGAELLRFALRQPEIRDRSLFVLGEPAYYSRFGFARCQQPRCPYDRDNLHFLSMNHDGSQFTIGYEREFKTASK